MKRRKGLKRTFPKRWSASAVKAPAGPTKGWANEYYMRARSEGQDHPPSKQWVNEWGKGQGKDRVYHITLIDRSDIKLRLYFSGEIYFFIETIVEAEWSRKSRNYGSRSRALEAYEKEDISWKIAGPSSDPRLQPIPS